MPRDPCLKFRRRHLPPARRAVNPELHTDHHLHHLHLQRCSYTARTPLALRCLLPFLYVSAAILSSGVEAGGAHALRKLYSAPAARRPARLGWRQSGQYSRDEVREYLYLASALRLTHCPQLARRCGAPVANIAGAGQSPLPSMVVCSGYGTQNRSQPRLTDSEDCHV